MDEEKDEEKVDEAPSQREEARDEEAVWEAYRPSHNAGPHFYLPVLRYVTEGQLERERRDEQQRGGGTAPTRRPTAADRKRSAAAAVAAEEEGSDVRELSSVEQRHEKAELAHEEDFTTDHREDLPPSEPASILSPSAASDAPAAASSSATSTSTGSAAGELILQPMRWGLIPHWTSAKDLSSADASQSYTMINARAESLDQARTYKALIHSRRCVTVVDAYYEWHEETTAQGRMHKQPFAFRPNYRTGPLNSSDSTLEPIERYDRDSDDKPFLLLASLFDTWWDASRQEVLYSVTILTTSAGQKVGWCHERQPVVLSHANARKWLQCAQYPWEACRDFVIRPWTEGIEWSVFHATARSSPHPESDRSSAHRRCVLLLLLLLLQVQGARGCQQCPKPD